MNEKRRTMISRMLTAGGGLSVKELAEAMQVSEMTVRRDLKELAATGGVQMVNGVAFIKSGVYDLMSQIDVNFSQKDAICRRAAQMIEDGDVVFIDAGTTVTTLPGHIRPKADITVVCTALPILVEMQRKEVEHIIFGGGYYYRHTQSFESEEAVQMLSKVRMSKAFITAAGAGRELGLTCAYPYEVGLKQVGLRNAQQRILLMDSSKFGKISPAFVADWSQIDTVITDEGIDGEWRQFLDEKGIELLIA